MAMFDRRPTPGIAALAVAALTLGACAGVAPKASAQTQAQVGAPGPWTLELGVGMEFFAEGPPELVLALGGRRGGWGLELELRRAATPQTPSWRFSLVERLQHGPWQGSVELGLEGGPYLTLQAQVQGRGLQGRLRLETASEQEPVWTLGGSWHMPRLGVRLGLDGLQIAGRAVKLRRAEMSWQPPDQPWAFRARWQPQDPEAWELGFAGPLLGWRLSAEVQLAPDGQWSQGRLEAGPGRGPWRAGTRIARDGGVEGWVSATGRLDQADTLEAQGRLVVGAGWGRLGEWSWRRIELQGLWRSALGLSRAQGTFRLDREGWGLNLEGDHYSRALSLRGRARLSPQGLSNLLLMGSLLPSDALALDGLLQQAGPLWLLELSGSLALSEELSLEGSSSWRFLPVLSGSEGWRWERGSAKLGRSWTPAP